MGAVIGIEINEIGEDQPARRQAVERGEWRRSGRRRRQEGLTSSPVWRWAKISPILPTLMTAGPAVVQPVEDRPLRRRDGEILAVRGAAEAGARVAP